MVFSFITSVAAAASFIERSLTFKSQDGTTLSGALTLPEIKSAQAKVPAVLLIAGSGPTDRDGNQPPGLVSDLLKQMAHGFASKGVASFRFDKRAAHVNKMQWPTKDESFPKFLSWENHLADVQSAFKAMQSSKEIDPKRLAILGHSEGGVLALAQAEVLSPQALVLVGTPGRKFGDILISQISVLLDKQGASAETKNEYLKKMAEIHKLIVEKGEIPSDVPAGLKVLYPPSAKIFLRDIVELDPNSFAKKFRGSVLIVNGELDTQVNAGIDAKALANTFEARGLKKQKLAIIPGASHNLKKVSGPLDPGISGPIDPAASDVLTSWILKNL